jgi:hypothetical protein
MKIVSRCWQKNSGSVAAGHAIFTRIGLRREEWRYVL